MERELIVVYVIFALLIAATIYSVMCITKDRQDNAQRMNTQGCVQIDYISSTSDFAVGTGLSMAGTATMTVVTVDSPAHYKYQCRNGETLWLEYDISRYVK